ncbi:hypothetical protein [Hymenobacter ruricola]|uniref:Uncharacterized protein n=1 Tax=Hymenobacter ruricola TaxID=2791023 RepID=A0ABS0I493_9BACT|nr:hypothetical protein [Hymenobacter ruricola]MBF9221369.1 hypothetical protein [Hymenobacter ruricola]
MCPTEGIPESALRGLLRKVGVQDPRDLIQAAIQHKLLRRVHPPLERQDAEESTLVLLLNTPESCPAPLFYEYFCRRAARPTRYQRREFERAEKAKHAAARRNNAVVPPAWEDSPPPHPQAAALLDYYCGDEEEPCGTVTLPVLIDRIKRGGTTVQALTAAVASVRNTPFEAAITRLQYTIGVRGLETPAEGRPTAAGLGLLHLDFDPVAQMRHDVQALLRQDEYLRDGMLGIFGEPQDGQLTLFVELAPLWKTTGEALAEWLGYFHRRYRAAGLTCYLPQVDGQPVQRVKVWHDPDSDWLPDLLRCLA